MPESEALSESEWADIEVLVTRALASRVPGIRRRIVLLLRLLDGFALLRHGRRLGRLDTARRVRFLHRMQHSRLATLRSGIWGLRTLAFLGYYGRPEAAAGLGYRARAGGWSELA